MQVHACGVCKALRTKISIFCSSESFSLGRPSRLRRSLNLKVKLNFLRSQKPKYPQNV